MTFNLLRDAWIPVRRRSGRAERIAPWQLTEESTADPIVALASTRHDFDGAHAQFLIGIVQTAAPPADKRAWRQAWASPPTPDALRAAIEPLAPSFALDGDGPRFGQDIALSQAPTELTGVAQLLPEQPGANTLKNNGDLWVKRGSVTALCRGCVSSALYALMLNGPAGGSGHRTGLRGGGPLTTLLVGGTLWETVWLNVLPQTEFDSISGNVECRKPEDRFPWMAPTRTSEPRAGVRTTPIDGHPLLVFWAMPRRIHLVFDEAPGNCDICGATNAPIVSHYRTRNYGADYEGWIHPLTPHYAGSDGTRLPVHGQPGGAGYRHWLGWVVPDGEAGKEPAAVVTARRYDTNTRDLARRLWAFGYDMDSMKARGWVEGVMPLPAPETDVAAYDAASAGMVHAANAVARTLRQALKAAWYREPKRVRGDFSFIDAAFWQRTESPFYHSLHELATAVSDEAGAPVKEEWLRVLARVADDLFVEYAQVGSYDAADPKRTALAHRDLRMFTAPSGKRLRDLLQLPPVATANGTARAARRLGRRGARSSARN